jgi:toxin CcdB
MARFDVHRNPNPRSKDRIPYLLDIQAGVLESLATRLVVPLIPVADFGAPIERLNPVVRLGNRNYVLATAEMAAVSKKSIGEKAGTLEAQSAAILAAVDFLISGF